MFECGALTTRALGIKFLTVFRELSVDPPSTTTTSRTRAEQWMEAKQSARYLCELRVSTTTVKRARSPTDRAGDSDCDIGLSGNCRRQRAAANYAYLPRLQSP